MDAFSAINPAGDSSLVIAREADRRGHAVYHYLPSSLTWQQGVLEADASRMHFDGTASLPQLAPSATTKLDTFDILFIRQDPPFDMGYVANTLLLEQLPKTTMVINPPASIRSLPEKISVLQHLEITPPTLITSSLRATQEFHREHKSIVIKPLFGNGGSGVFHVGDSGVNLATIVELYAGRCPFIVQKFLPQVQDGDTRIILIDGEFAGALNRLPSKGEIRANLHIGGIAAVPKLSPRMHTIIEAISPQLKEAGIVFAGIDVIGDWLTEINITSPTCLVEIAETQGVRLEGKLWDTIEEQYLARHAR